MTAPIVEADLLVLKSDADRAATLYRAIGGSEVDLAIGVIPGAPQSKSRPRFSKGRVYSPGDLKRAEAITGWHLKRIRPGSPLTGNVAVCCLFYRPNALRIDTDNLLKHVFDSANGILWNDDSQVTALTAVTELDRDNPRTVIIVGDHESSLRRGTNSTAWRTCDQCGNRFYSKAGPAGQPTCSATCAVRRKGFEPCHEPIPCAHCGKLFRRVQAIQRLCSQRCRLELLADRNKRESGTWAAGRRQPSPTCPDCGKPKSRKAQRCRDCWAGNFPTRRGDVEYSPSSWRHRATSTQSVSPSAEQ